MARTRRARSSKRPPPGSAPGTLAVEPGLPPPPIRVIAYGTEKVEEPQGPTLDIATSLIRQYPVTWIDIDGVQHEPTLVRAAQLAGLHPLALADVANTLQRPKVEDYGTYLFIVLRLPHRVPDSKQLETEQASIVVGKNLVITFQEEARPGDCFDPVRHRIRTGAGRTRQYGTDFLAYALIDAVIDGYFPELERLGERLEDLEQRMLSKPEAGLLHELHAVRRDLLTIRRSIWPLRDALSQLIRDQIPLITPETRVFLRDCADHANQILDLVEAYREIGSALMEVHLTAISNRMNEIMKVLTIIATIFIPLTFIVGIYGMNFDTRYPLNMPELRSPYGYIAVWLVMLGVAGFMLWVFWKRGWIGRR